MKFGSWTYDKFSIDLQPSADAIDLSTYSISGEWKLIGKEQNFTDCDLLTNLHAHVRLLIHLLSQLGVTNRSLCYIYMCCL